MLPSQLMYLLSPALRVSAAPPVLRGQQDLKDRLVRPEQTGSRVSLAQSDPPGRLVARVFRASLEKMVRTALAALRDLLGSRGHVVLPDLPEQTVLPVLRGLLEQMVRMAEGSVASRAGRKTAG